MSQSVSAEDPYDKTNLLSRPYAERQFIVVADDVVVEAERKARQLAAPRNVASWIDLTKDVVSNLPAVLAKLAIEPIEARNRLRDQGVKVLTVARSEAEALKFPPGNPRDKVLYVGHPAIPEVYQTIPQFHRLTFVHKVCEVVRLLVALGASTIEVEHIAGWAREFAAKASIPLPTIIDQAGSDGGKNESRETRILFSARLPGHTSPRLPDKMVWYPTEPTWQMVAESRLEYGCEGFKMDVTYEEDYGVNAGLKQAAVKAGFELSEEFEDHRSTIWRIHGDFKGHE